MLPGLDDAEEREVVALGAAGGEDDLLRLGAEQTSYRGACLLDGGAGALARLMDGAGVAKLFEQVRTHRLEDLRQQRCGGVGVHVDSTLRLQRCAHAIQFTPFRAPLC